MGVLHMTVENRHLGR